MALPKRQADGITGSHRLDDPHGVQKTRDLQNFVTRARVQGGRVLATEDRKSLHIVSPSGRRWGSYDQKFGTIMGGDLSPITGRSNDDLYDITDEFDGK